VNKAMTFCVVYSANREAEFTN